MIKIKDYEIKWSLKQKRWICNCPDFKYRRSKNPGEVCKHIYQASIEGHLALRKVNDPRYKERMFFEPTVELVHDLLSDWQHCFCGSYRRQSPIMKDIDVIVLCEDSKHFLEIEDRIKHVGIIESGGDQKITCNINNCQVDFRICYDQRQWPFMMLHFTGSKVENIRLRKIATSKGYMLSEYGLKNLSSELFVHGLDSEQKVYGYLGEKYMEPHLR